MWKPPGVSVIIAITLLGTACGGGSSPDLPSLQSKDGPQDKLPIPDNPQDAYLAYEECMHAAGIEDYQAPEVDSRGRVHEEMTGPGSSDASFEEMNAADEKCRYLLANATVEVSDEQAAEIEDAMLEYTDCMREEGIDMPDPQPGSGLLVDASRMDEPSFAAAHERCKETLDVDISGSDD